MKQKKTFKRFLRQQKKVQKIKLQLPNQHPLALNDLKALFQIRKIKEFHVIIESDTDSNFNLLHQLLLYIKKKKTWPLRTSQKVTLKMSSKIERHLDEQINQLTEKLWKLKGLLKRTFTELEIQFESIYKFSPELWRRFVEGLTYLTTLKRLELKGDVRCQEFEKIMESVKGLKMLEKISFRLKPWIEFYSSSNYLKDIGRYLRDFSLNLDIFDVSRNSNLLGFITELRTLSRLQYFDFKCNKLLGASSPFFQIFSESLSAMTDLRNLNLWLTFEGVDAGKNLLKDGTENLFATIGSLTKLETIFLGFDVDKEEHEIRFEALCGFLKNLKNLKSLGLSLSMPKIVDQEIEPFLIDLPQLEQLEELFLEFQWGKELQNETIGLVFKNMAQLKWLRRISLDLKCTRINDDFGPIFSQAMNQLRCLKETRIRIHRTIHNIDTENYVRETVKRLQQKMNIDMMFQNIN